MNANFHEILERIEKERKEHPVREFKYKCQRGVKNVKRVPFHAKCFIERGKKGYSIEDVWGFDTYLANVIAGGTKRLREINHGHPTDLTNEEWLKILDEISNAFVKYNKEMDEVELYAKENLAGTGAWGLLQEWFPDLWD